MAILIVRHGETFDNAKRILQAPESPLSNDGLVQAKRLANRLDKFKVQRIICSDYLRTRQTAQIASESTGVKVELDKGLRERNFGDWRGQSYDALSVNPLDDSSKPPNGETIADFEKRIARAWQYITNTATHTDDDLLVVTHGLVCKALLKNHLQLNDETLIPTHWGNTALTVVQQKSPWVVQKLNCAEHLSDSLNKRADKVAPA